MYYKIPYYHKKRMETLKKYWNISEVSEMIGVNKSAIRFWEKEFDMKIKRFSKNERRYTEFDINQLQKIKRFVNTSRSELLNMFESQNPKEMKAIEMSKAQKRLQELILSKKSYYVKRSDYEKIESKNKELVDLLQRIFNYHISHGFDDDGSFESFADEITDLI